MSDYPGVQLTHPGGKDSGKHGFADAVSGSHKPLLDTRPDDESRHPGVLAPLAFLNDPTGWNCGILHGLTWSREHTPAYWPG